MRNKAIILVVYLAIFLIFFIQYPIQNSLTGNLDSIANLAMFQQLKMYIDSWIHNTTHGTLCYPIENVMIYFGADFGAGIIHVFFSYLGIPDVWANWLFISIVFTLNAFALFLFLNLIVKDKWIAFFGSLLFNFSHFVLANLENPNALFFSFFFLSLYYYYQYLASEASNTKFLFIAAILGCIQVYLSPYLFLFHTIVWFVLILSKEPKLFSKSFLIRYSKIAVLYLVITSPFLYFFVFNKAVDESVNSIFEQDYTFLFSLNSSDFGRVLPNHLYRDYVEIFNNPFLSKIKAAFLGYTFYLLALWGLIKLPKKWIWLLIGLVGLILSIGPYWVKDINNMSPFIMYPFYEYLGFGDILRVPSRAFFITVLALTILAVYGLKWIKDTFPKYPFWLLPCFLILLENVPLKMETYQQENVLYPDTNFINYLKSEPEAIVLHLPSHLGNFNGDRNEYIYMYWQHIHQKSILNGNLAFVPPPRIEVDNAVKSMSKDLIAPVLTKNKVTTITYHKDLPHVVNAPNYLDSLNSFPFLEKVLETQRVAIFKVMY